MPRLNLKRQAEDLGFTDISLIIGPGVYLLGYADEVVWVGKSVSLGSRIGKHLIDRNFAFDTVYAIPVPQVDLDVVESFLILKLNPRYNVVSTRSLYHKVKRGLIGHYDRADRRRMEIVMGRMGVNFDELLTRQLGIDE